MEAEIKELMGFQWMKILSVTEDQTVNKNMVVLTDKGKYFIKWNTLSNSKEVFETEYAGLLLLKTVGVIRTPKPYLVGQVRGGAEAFIVLEYLENLQSLTTCSVDFAHALAKLHQYNLNKEQNQPGSAPVTQFGCEQKVFFGPHFYIPENTWYQSWDKYFTQEILEPQFSFSQQNLDDQELKTLWQTLKPKISGFFKDVDIRPSLCIGDVGSDNVGQVGNIPVLFDPYCFYGHYEFDLTQPYVSQDFNLEFYDAYFEMMPKEEGYNNRKLLYRVFACMVRHNYGMPGYLDQAKQTIKELISV